MNSTVLSANAASIARLAAGVVGGILTSIGVNTDNGTLETIIGAVLIAVAGIWSIIKNAKTKQEADAAKKAVKVAGSALLVCLLLGASGCAVIFGKAGSSSYTGFAFGEKASSTLAGLNITETKTEDGNIVTDSGVGVDKSGASGEADMGKILGNLLLLGLQSQGIPARSSAVSDSAESDAVEVDDSAPAESATPKTKAVKKTKAKSAALPPESVAANATVLAEKMAEAKTTGKPLVVIAGNTGCGYCSSLDKLLDSDLAFAGRSDIVLYRETSPWAGNQAGKWTGGGLFPVLRVTQWDTSGKVICDTKINRPKSVADIEAAIGSCSSIASQ